MSTPLLPDAIPRPTQRSRSDVASASITTTISSRSKSARNCAIRSDISSGVSKDPRLEERRGLRSWVFSDSPNDFRVKADLCFRRFVLSVRLQSLLYRICQFSKSFRLVDGQVGQNLAV